MIWDTFDGIFFLSLGTLLVGAFGVSMKYCFRSRCHHFSLCCGLVEVQRRVELETQEHLKEIEMGISGDEEEKTDGIDLSKLKK